MSLTLGSAPFGQAPAGRFNFARPEGGPVLYLERSPRRVRAMAAGATVADSVRATLLHQSGRLPVYCFRQEDVRADLLAPAGRRQDVPGKGAAEWLEVRSDGRRVPDAGWRWASADPAAPWLEGLVSFRWDAMDAWWEEDEEVFVHAKDPYHRVDVLESRRRVVVRLDGDIVADSARARVLFETSLPARWYLPPEDVRTDLLAPMDLRTRCPYKGQARFWTVSAGGRAHEAVVWSYPEPLAAVSPIAGRLCFFNERVDLEIDGVAQQSEPTPWSSREWWRAGGSGPPGLFLP